MTSTEKIWSQLVLQGVEELVMAGSSGMKQIGHLTQQYFFDPVSQSEGKSKGQK